MILLRRLTAHNFKQLRDIDLLLPAQGRFLVQGLNEAGKSTLFEAVFFALFGRPLSTEGGRASLEDLVHYGSEESFVALELDLAGGRRLSITRRIRSGRANVWALDVLDGAGGVEEVRGNREVNARVEAELGFDGAALLDTCFVEQKKLEKLEGMSRSQREQSLMKLLNLDRLIEIGDRLKVRGVDRQDLERLADRARLARLQSERPALQARFDDLSRRLARLEAHAGVEAALTRLGELEASAAELETARARASREAERAARVAELSRGLDRWETGQAAAARAREAAEAAASLREERQLALRLRDERLPEVTARGKALARLRRRRAWLGDRQAEQAELEARIRARDEALDALAEDLEQLNTARRELVEARAVSREARDEQARLEQDRRAFAVREGLIEWLSALDARAGRGDTHAALDAALARRVGLGRRTRLLAMALAGASLAWLALASLVGLVLGLSPLWILLLALAALAVAGLAVMTWPSWRAGQALAVEIGRLQGEAAAAARETDRLDARVAEAEARLAQLNAVLPADADRGRQVLAELDGRLEGRDRAAVDAALQATLEREARAAARAESLLRREQELRGRTIGRDGAALGRERDAWSRRLERLALALDRRGPRIARLAESLGIDASAQTLEDEVGALREQFGALRRQVESIPGLEASLAQAEAREASSRAASVEAWQALPATIRGAEGSQAPDEVAWQAAGEALRAAHAAAGGQAVERAAAAAARAAAEHSGRHASLGAALQKDLQQLDRRLEALGDVARLELRLPMSGGAQPDGAAAPASEADPSPSVMSEAAAPNPGARYAPARSQLERLRASLAPEPGSAGLEDLEARRADLRSQLDVARHETARLESRLGLAGQLLDLELAEAEHQRAARELAVRERAGDIVGHASRNAVRRILPSTLTHMRRLLPALTEQRYFDAQLSDDYRIQVYDERAGAWKMKNIFSGGTRDQLSLALRLAFALATLPEERGAAPSFLFLDEPLGAFDAQRAQALLHLLTQGEIAESFDQIFLISHVKVEPGLFDYHLLLNEGTVAESDLPATPDSARPDQS